MRAASTRSVLSATAVAAEPEVLGLAAVPLPAVSAAPAASFAAAHPTNRRVIHVQVSRGRGTFETHIGDNRRDAAALEKLFFGWELAKTASIISTVAAVTLSSGRKAMTVPLP